MWVRRGNVFDPIQTELDQAVFKGITPRKHVLSFITDEFYQGVQQALDADMSEYMELYLTGSLTTYQWSDSSDADVSVFVDYDGWSQVTGQSPKEIRISLVEAAVHKLDGTFLVGTQHPLQHFVVMPKIQPTDLFKPGMRSAFSFKDNAWVVEPEKTRVHNIADELPVLYHRAQDMADKMENLLTYDPIGAKLFWEQVHWKRQQDEKKGLGDFSEGNIIYKYLLHNGYFDRIRKELGVYIAKVAGMDDEGMHDWSMDDLSGVPPEDPGKHPKDMTGDEMREYQYQIQVPMRWLQRAEQYYYSMTRGLQYETMPNAEECITSLERAKGQLSEYDFDVVPAINALIAATRQGEDPRQLEDRLRTITRTLGARLSLLVREEERARARDQEGEIPNPLGIRSDITLAGHLEGVAFRVAAAVRELNGESNVHLRGNDTKNDNVGAAMHWVRVALEEGADFLYDHPTFQRLVALADQMETRTMAEPEILSALSSIELDLEREAEEVRNTSREDAEGNVIHDDPRYDMRQRGEEVYRRRENEKWRRIWPHLKISTWRLANNPEWEHATKETWNALEQDPELAKQVYDLAREGTDILDLYKFVVARLPELFQTIQPVHVDWHSIISWLAQKFDKPPSLWRRGDPAPEYDPESGWSEEDWHNFYAPVTPKLEDVNGYPLANGDRVYHVWMDEPRGRMPKTFVYGTIEDYDPNRGTLNVRWDDGTVQDFHEMEAAGQLEYAGERPEVPDTLPDNWARVAVEAFPTENYDPAKEESVKVIYDYDNDTLLLGSQTMAAAMPSGKILGEYTQGDVVLYDNPEIWLNGDYFKKLWTHSFPKRDLHSLFIESDGEHIHVPTPGAQS